MCIRELLNILEMTEAAARSRNARLKRGLIGRKLQMMLHKPNDTEAYYNRGMAYYKEHEYDKAITAFSEVIKLHPEFTEVYVKRASVYFQIGGFECAIQDYDQVLELKPKFAEIYAARGIMSLHVEKWESAKLDLTFARNLRVNIINVFHQMYDSITDFEEKNNVRLPEDIAAILVQQ